MRHQLQLRGRVFVCLVLIGFVASLGALVVLPVWSSTNAVDDDARERVDDAATTSTVAVTNQLNAVRALSKVYSERLGTELSSDATPSEPDAEVRNEITELHAANDDISFVLLLDPKGNVVANAPFNESSLGSSRADREFFQNALRAKDPTISGVIFARAPGQPHVVVVSQPIYRVGTNDLLAVLGISINVTKSFQGWVDRLHSSHEISVTIYDSHGAVVARPGLGNELITSTNTRIVGRDRGKAWSGVETVDGRSVVSSYAPLPDYRWTVRAMVERTTTLAPIESMRNGIVIAAAFLLVTLLTGLLVLRRLFNERASVQRSLTQTEERMREVIETAEQMFIEVDRDGRITAWNRKAEETLGWTSEEVVGKTVLEVSGFIPDTQRPTVERRLAKLAATEDGQSWRQRIESVVLRKGTSDQVHIEMSMWTTRAHGELRLAALMQDITARKRFEAERENLVKQQNRLVNELRRTDKTKSDFVSTVSHELRTPLTSIVGYLEMLRDGFGGDLSSQQSSMLEVVDRNSRRLLSLIEDLLTLSRIEAGTFRVEPNDVDVSQLVTGVLQAMIPSATQASIQVEADVAADTGAVRGDYDQLERVLMNIVSNAIKFTPENGRVCIKASRDGEHVRISVSDTGIGIAVEEQSRLFSRFFRSPDAQARAIQGTGLGLTIVKSIVERHGGEVSLRSAFGVGTTVNIVLPSAHDALVSQ